MELPSCIESLVSSAEQLQQLAQDGSQYYIKNLLIYGLSGCEANLNHSKSLAKDESKTLPSRQKGLHSVSTQQMTLDEISKDDQYLKVCNSIVHLIPFLNDLNQFIEKCFVTIELTLRRSTYYLNKAMEVKNRIDDEPEFRLNTETKINITFLSIMDLVYSLVSLDKTLIDHTNIYENLDLFIRICKLANKSSNSEDEINDSLKLLKQDKLKQLIDQLENLKFSLFNKEPGKMQFFRQLLDHLKHLNYSISETTNKGYKLLAEKFADFIIFYSERIASESEFLNSNGPNSMNGFNVSDNIIELENPQQQSQPAHIKCPSMIHSTLIPTNHIDQKAVKIFGLSMVFLIYINIFSKLDKKVLKTFNQFVQKQCKSFNSIIPLAMTSSFISLSEFFEDHQTQLKSANFDCAKVKKFSNEFNRLSTIKLNLHHEFERHTLSVAKWLIKFKTISQICEEPKSNKLALLCRQGHEFSVQLNYLVRSVISTHLHYSTPISKNHLIILFRLIALKQSIRECLTRRRFSIESYHINMEPKLRMKWSNLFQTIQKRLISIKYSERKLDPNLVLVLTSICFKINPFDCTRRDKLTLALSLSMLISSLNQDEIAILHDLLSISNWTVDLESHSTLCGHLFWNLSTLSTYYSNAFQENPCALNEINYFHSALDDVAGLFQIDESFYKLNDSWLNLQSNQLLKRLESESVESFKTHFLDNICQEFEIELRLQTHRDLHLNAHNPFKRHLYNFKYIFSKDSEIRIFKKQLSLKSYVEHYLNKICYNLTAISPTDWFTYDRMINLAERKFNLKFAKLQLPTQTLDYGLDLLEIIRNLASFSSKYTYDMTNQLFIEKCVLPRNSSSASSLVSASTMHSTILNQSILLQSSNAIMNQNLNVLQVKHVAKSIQTHGFGLLNSSVNCTYQVMKRLINLFVKQISMDEQLRAILVKEHHQLINENSMKDADRYNVYNSLKTLSPKATGINLKAGHQFPAMNFDKANKLAKRFKLSTTNLQPRSEQQKFDFDSLRQLITQLGNLLAFIRMLKAGALNCSTKSVDYLPEFDNNLINGNDESPIGATKFENFVKNEFKNYDNELLMRAGKNLDHCLEDFNQIFSTRTNYFGILVEIFSKILTPISRRQSRQEQSTGSEVNNSHADHEKSDQVKLFFLMIPALTINFVDYITNCKERLSSKSAATRFGALISDDGFPMGIAFLLIILNQTEQFSQLEWFKQVKLKLESDLINVRQRIEDSSYEESLKQTSNMTLKRLNKLLIEYESLNFTLSSAQMFFRSFEVQNVMRNSNANDNVNKDLN